MSVLCLGGRMQVNLHVAWVTLIALAGIAGCGGYSAPSSPSNPPTAGGSDSTSDTMPRPGYLHR
jgi:hypothetical protein